jgi:hypothetical protein
MNPRRGQTVITKNQLGAGDASVRAEEVLANQLAKKWRVTLILHSSSPVALQAQRPTAN